MTTTTGSGTTGSGGTGEGHHAELVPVAENEDTLEQDYAIDQNVHAVHGRVVVSTPPAEESGEPHQIHIVGLSGLKPGDYCPYFVYDDGATIPPVTTTSPTGNTCFRIVAGEETEASYAIPSVIVGTFMVEITAKPATGPETLPILETKNPLRP